jgi:hypothetical protein
MSVSTALGRWLVAEHTCNGLCRDGAHASVIWVRKHVPDAVAGLRGLCAASGLAFVHAAPAPEAVRDGPPLGAWQDGATTFLTRWEDEDRPYLLVWRAAA